MYRRKQNLGFSAVALGLGVLLGCSIASAFWSCVLGLGAILSGFLLLQKK